jgi:serine/threonine-protein kinase
MRASGARVIGTTLGHYTITSEIGRGGMGVVYRAHDGRLGRDVAVKVLHAEVSRDADRLARFTREARAVAALAHPNIVSIFDFGTEGDVAYAVMELLEGHTLAEEIRRKAPLPLETALHHAIRIAAGLARAHGRHIVHRDLKPQNVFLTLDDQLKILDFGLAKQLPSPSSASSSAPTDDPVTVAHTLMGTIGYLAPERITTNDADHRADLFALGIIVYEMLTGANPFLRPSPYETISAILRDAPSFGGLPASVRGTIQRCLEKAPEDRPASAHELEAHFRACHETNDAEAPAASGRSPLADRHDALSLIDSLAVLPFHNEVNDSDADYLIDGLTDSLIDNLSQLPRLKVMARSTVFRCREFHDRPSEAGAQLGVRAVLTGRLRRRGGALVVRTELVNTADGALLWGARFDRPMGDFLEIEQEICGEITKRLTFRLSREEAGLVTRRHTQSADAHEAYLKGRYVWGRWKTPEAMHTAIGFFQRAIELDPLFARAYAGLADSYNMLGNLKALAPGEAYPRAKAAAERGLAIDDALAELHTSLAFIQRFWDWDWPASRRSFERAIELNPGYANAHRFYSHLLAGLGEHDASIEHAKRALDLDPLSLLIHTAVGDALFYARRYEEAAAYYRKSLELDPDFLAGHTDLARTLELSGRYDEAIAEYRAGARLAPDGPPEPSSGLAHVYARMGRRDEALVIVDDLNRLSARRYVSPYGIGSIYASLGEVETALDYLDRAFAEHDQTLVWVKVHPRLDPLRDHPRYRDLLHRMRLTDGDTQGESTVPRVPPA